MSTISFDRHDTILKILKRLPQEVEAELKLNFPPESAVWRSPRNLSIIQFWAHQKGKKVTIEGGEKKEEPAIEGELPQPAPTSPKKTKRLGLSRTSKIFIFLFVIFLFFAGAAATFVYFYLPKAEVRLIVEERPLEYETTVILKEGLTQPVVETKELPVEEIKVANKETEVFASTGEKDVGEKAKGEVTIRNWTDEEVIFEAGTKIISRQNQNLTLLLDNSVAVPAQTITGEEPDQRVITAGKANVSVTAFEIGPEHNLSNKHEFTISDKSFADFPLTNESSFSGGARRTVTVVSPEDQERAKEQLKSKLFAQGMSDLQKKLLENEKLVAETIKQVLINVEYGNQVDAEVEHFNVTASTESTGLAYDQRTLSALLKQDLANSIPQGFTLSGLTEELSAGLITKTEDEKILMVVNLKTLVVPDYDLDKIKYELKGKRLEQGEEVLNKLPHLQRHEIVLWPRLPAFLQTFPFREERLKIELTVQ